MLCFVQSKYVKVWLKLAKYNYKKKVWEYPRYTNRFPYDPQDSYFQSAVRYLDFGYTFFKWEDTPGKDYAFIIPLEILENAKKEFDIPNVVIQNIDTRDFFIRLTNKDRLTKKELEAKLKEEFKEIFDNSDLVDKNSWLRK